MWARACLTSCIRQHTSAYVLELMPTAACVLDLMRTPAASLLSSGQHTSAYVSIRQHTSSYVLDLMRTAAASLLHLVSLRQRTSAYVSIRQHASLLHLVPSPAGALTSDLSRSSSLPTDLSRSSSQYANVWHTELRPTYAMRMPCVCHALALAQSCCCAAAAAAAAYARHTLAKANVCHAYAGIR
jgi:hypothetical protein